MNVSIILQYSQNAVFTIQNKCQGVAKVNKLQYSVHQNQHLIYTVNHKKCATFLLSLDVFYTSCTNGIRNEYSTIYLSLLGVLNQLMTS